MRYRPVGKHATIVSALSIGLAEDGSGRKAADWTALIFAALENGINGFEIHDFTPPIAEGVAQALQAVDRELIFVTCRMGRARAGQAPMRDFSDQVLAGQLRALLGRTGLRYLDVAMLDEPKSGEVPEDGLNALQQAREAGVLRMLGFSGADDAIEAHMATARYDVLGTVYNLTSGWRERNWLRTAGKYDMAVFGYDSYPADFHAGTKAAAKARRAAHTGRVEALEGVGSYDFLDHTKGWPAEDICLAYALTEPALASVQLRAPSIEALDRLSAVTEREMPPGLAAQIEMARFAPVPDARRSA